MSKLLVRARMVAKVIKEADLAKHVRVAYSGHKGIHLYIDFPELPRDLGSINRYKNGLNEYANSLLDFLSGEAGVEWTPYCVPGLFQELVLVDASTHHLCLFTSHTQCLPCRTCSSEPALALHDREPLSISRGLTTSPCYRVRKSAPTRQGRRTVKMQQGGQHSAYFEANQHWKCSG
jgi:hypothetical protein